MNALAEGRLVVRDLATLTGRSAWKGFVSFYESDDLTYAASIAYYSLLSLFPFLMLALAILGNLTTDPALREGALDVVMRYFPAQFDFITEQLDPLRATSFTFGLLGSMGLLWGALGVFGAVSTAVNHAWGVEKQRNFWQHKLFSFLMLMVAGLLLLAALLLVSSYRMTEMERFAELIEAFPGLSVLRSFLVRYAATPLFILVVGLVYYFVPNTKVRFRDVWIGAVITGLLWTVALAGFSWVIRDMGRFARVNGSIAAVVTFLVWVYIQAVIMLYGVEFTATYARLRGDR